MATNCSLAKRLRKVVGADERKTPCSCLWFLDYRSFRSLQARACAPAHTRRELFFTVFNEQVPQIVTSDECPRRMNFVLHDVVFDGSELDRFKQHEAFVNTTQWVSTKSLDRPASLFFRPSRTMPAPAPVREL